tara:strand:- start:1658 stop:2779 length:1122 start_codon:yes stop_codon:yes gene_type:complete
MQQLAVLKEEEQHQIVSLSPDSVKKLSKEFNICIEKDAGLSCGFSNEDYERAGASIRDYESLLKEADIILSFLKKASPLRKEKLQSCIGFYGILNHPEAALAFEGRNCQVFSLDLMPRTSLAQSMDLVSTLASISGYQAALLAAEQLPMVVPMMSSAAGTLPPAKYLVLGAGVAGLQAIATSKRLGAVVEAFDVRSSTKTEVASLGAKFIEIEGAEEDQNAGGYAIEQKEAYLQKVNQRITEVAAKADVVITTAKIPGKKAPILLPTEAVMQMKKGSIIIDLAAENGGNCTLTESDQIIDFQGVKIFGLNSLLNRCSTSASMLISNNFTAFLKHLLNREALGNDDILTATKIVENGKIIHPYLNETLSTKTYA